MEQTSNLVAYLRTRSGGKEVLTPKQLEPILGISVKQQSLLRKENKLGFPYLTIGGKILYSIHAVAEMLTRPTQTAPTTPETAKNEKPSASKSKAVDKWRSSLKVPSSQPINMSQALLRAFVLNNIQTEISALTSLTFELQALQRAAELSADLEKRRQHTATEKKPRVKI
ncbi:hypothetical protein [Limnohabitans sp.]|uniref:hypothetical protein n=1 Tax=Limnohabitans sp. TaxID=1907725 RepID=UPI002FDE42B0